LNINFLQKNKRDAFIESNKNFIYGVAHKICRRHLRWENDDELSIGLIAFNKACDTYEEKKGEFFSYAKLIIRNSLIDYFRKSANTPYLIFDDEEENTDYIDIKLSLENYSIASENAKRAEEIGLLSKELAEYKLDFNILLDSSPSHSDTRNSLLNLALKCCNNESILNSIKSKKLLPIKEICILTGCNKKLLEKWRRYIIVLVVILSSDEYPYIRSYLNIKVGENNE
jgi:RNA polymerase sigma factor